MPLVQQEAQADVRPKVLRHSLPSKIYYQPPDSSTLSTSKWFLHSEPSKGSSLSADAFNSLRGYLSPPQVIFGPKRLHYSPSIKKVEKEIKEMAKKLNDLCGKCVDLLVWLDQHPMLIGLLVCS